MTESFTAEFTPKNGDAHSVPVRIVELEWQKRGLRETASGYGLKLTTRYQIALNGKWRRVYCCQIANAGTLYIGKPGAWLGTVDIWRG